MLSQLSPTAGLQEEMAFVDAGSSCAVLVTEDWSWKKFADNRDSSSALARSSSS